MQAQRVIALAKRGNKMSVAISDPTNTQALDQIKFQTESTVEPVIVAHDALLQLLARISKSSEQSIAELAGEEADIQFAEEEEARPPWPMPAPTMWKTRRWCASSTRC
jgi:type IV pilus assembly protein PilB